MKTETNHFDFTDSYYLTDGGLETTLIFHKGLELNHFAAFELLNDRQGKEHLIDYYSPYLELAKKHNLNFILETPTWRANPDWGFKLGYNQQELNDINRKSIRFMRELKNSSLNGSKKAIISGNIGPRGDGYVSGNKMTPEEAQEYHQSQVDAFTFEGADIVTALTINYIEEAIGIVNAAKKAEIPVVISFTVETDGHLPGGESLQEAITKTDLATGAYATHYMINCAHPEHFREVLKDNTDWKNRIRGVRANASTKSHAELDEAENLDPGDKALLAERYLELKKILPELIIFGGCCGTDHSHMEEICEVVLGSS